MRRSTGSAALTTATRMGAPASRCTAAHLDQTGRHLRWLRRSPDLGVRSHRHGTIGVDQLGRDAFGRDADRQGVPDVIGQGVVGTDPAPTRRPLAGVDQDAGL